MLPDEPPDVARVGLDGLIARCTELVRIGVVDGEGGCFSSEPIAWCTCQCEDGGGLGKSRSCWYVQ